MAWLETDQHSDFSSMAASTLMDRSDGRASADKKSESGGDGRRRGTCSGHNPKRRPKPNFNHPKKSFRPSGRSPLTSPLPARTALESDGAFRNTSGLPATSDLHEASPALWIPAPVGIHSRPRLASVGRLSPCCLACSHRPLTPSILAPIGNTSVCRSGAIAVGLRVHNVETPGSFAAVELVFDPPVSCSATHPHANSSP
ncbi:hypothetical protein LIA77_07197 [Sarocladium implicatum]|nr:hypothetical protein LIA77_07197 [Sarocladium implicatum]